MKLGYVLMWAPLVLGVLWMLWPLVAELWHRLRVRRAAKARRRRRRLVICEWGIRDTLDPR